MTPSNQFQPAPLNAESAREALNVPAILLIVFGALGLLLGLLNLIKGSSGDDLDQLNQYLPQLTPTMKESMRAMANGGTRVMGLLSALLCGVLIFGGLQMRALKNYGVALAAAIIALLPCSSCCCVTMPIGIWALVLLLKPEIKASFT